MLGVTRARLDATGGAGPGAAPRARGRIAYSVNNQCAIWPMHGTSAQLISYHLIYTGVGSFSRVWWMVRLRGCAAVPLPGHGCSASPFSRRSGIAIRWSGRWCRQRARRPPRGPLEATRSRMCTPPRCLTRANWRAARGHHPPPGSPRQSHPRHAAGGDGGALAKALSYPLSVR